MNKVIVVVGPTAVGKTKMSVELALTLGGEVINADSMQVYKGLDIGTAKVKSNEKKGIKHHLFDIATVTQNYTVFDYQRDCRKKIEEVQKRGHIPILVGGTGLYIKAALYDYEFEKEEERLSFDHLSTEEIYHKILELDPESTVDSHNRRRLERCYTHLLKEVGPKVERDHLLYDALFIGLTTGREVLYNRIDTRVDGMLLDLVDEVKFFYDQNINSKALATGIGYKEFYDFFDGKATFREAVENVKQNSRNYAKKQYTWFLNQMDVEWFSVHFDDFDQTVKEVLAYLEKAL